MIEKQNQWSRAAEIGLKKALAGYEQYYEQEVNLGRCELFRVENHSWLITRIEFDAWINEKILVVCCYEGKELEPFVSYLIERYRVNGFSSIRFHTRSRALGEWMRKQFNFQVDEYIYKLRLN